MKKIISIAVAIITFGILGVVSSSPKAKAVSGADWNPGRIIDDVVFQNKDSMKVEQIQQFLNSKVALCDTKGTQTINYKYNPNTKKVDANNVSESGDTWITTSRALYSYRFHLYVKFYRQANDRYDGSPAADPNYYNPPTAYVPTLANPRPAGVPDSEDPWYTTNTNMVCLKDYYQNPTTKQSNYGTGVIPTGAKSAAQLIWDAAQAQNINPQVYMVLLQKEQSLIGDDWPWPVQYDKATGNNCPDTAPCNPTYAGFSTQVNNAGVQFNYYVNHFDQFNYAPGQNNILYSPNSSCGTKSVFIENKYTAALYIYTPYTPNQAALDNMYGEGDSCSAYGNRNFWRMFNDWFGSSITPPWNAQFLSLEDYTDDKKVTRISHNNLAPNQRIFLSMKFKNTGTSTWFVGGPGTMRISTEGGANPFCDTTWIACWRPANMKEASVAPGQTGTFEFWYKAPDKTYAAYANQFSLVSEMQSQVLGDKPILYTLVSQPKAQFLSLEDYTDDKKVTRISHNNLAPNQRIFLSMKFKNTGTSTWFVGGPGTMRISTEGGANPFCDTTWIACWRPANMKEASVAPGQTGTFEFWYKAPDKTYAAYANQFSLVSEMQSQVLGDKPILYTLVSQPKAQFLSLEDYTDDKKVTRISHNNLAPNQRIFLSMKFKNTGTSTWFVGGPGTMRISTEGGANPFCDTTWIACWRPANMKEASVAPGQTGTFEFWYKAPNVTYGQYSTQFSLVEEMQSQVLGDRPIAYTVVKAP